MKSKEIIRKPIMLNKNTVAVIHIFTRHDHLEDCWFIDVDEYEKEKYEVFERAAVQFIEQLEDRCNKLFMLKLRDEINKLLEEDK